MGKINFGRVLLGGLVAGLLMNVGEWLLNDVVLASQMKEYMSKHNYPTPTGQAIAIAVVLVFVTGVVMILIYAAIRPRFGGGPKTAIIAGLFAWFCVYVYGNVLGVAFGFWPSSLLPLMLGWGLVEYLLGALVGAWLYKEA